MIPFHFTNKISTSRLIPKIQKYSRCGHKIIISLKRSHLVFSTCIAGRLENTACDSPSKTNTSKASARSHFPFMSLVLQPTNHTAAFTSRHSFNTRKMLLRPELIGWRRQRNRFTCECNEWAGACRERYT